MVPPKQCFYQTSYLCSQPRNVDSFNSPILFPREFSHVLLCTIYISDKSAAKASSQKLSAAIHELEVESPDAFIGDTILDLCYSNIKDAYVANRLPNLGEADHNLVLLLPKYRPVVQRLKPRVISNIKQWSADAEDCLRDCFDSTDLSVFIDSSSDIHDLTETITCFPNNKPWITKEIKQMINEKKRAFGTGNKDNLKDNQRRLNRAVRKEKLRYKEKVERYFTDNNMSQVCMRGLRLMSGYTTGDSESCQLPQVSTSYADELNTFHNRFGSLDFSNEINYLRTQLTYNPEPFLVISEDKVRYQFSKINPPKAAGPDMLSPHVLRTCSGQLAGIFTHIFNLSYSTLAIPEIWKQSCIIPVPQSSTVSCMNDLPPVALTSVVMKICELPLGHCYLVLWIPYSLTTPQAEVMMMRYSSYFIHYIPTWKTLDLRSHPASCTSTSHLPSIRYNPTFLIKS
ncbi:hypothetical protein HOLleu_10919 [Holothuria leucospilota]|uniref:RNA-directed DNA polymerase from mobile element jockey n=1 Tax=Holothuria leucospilota TaxID=206669 RepID=A0A9Q1HEU1_HOLLE|nr:hypothetical protein HOLleu_10919 [Holothuria leucospilota]